MDTGKPQKKPENSGKISEAPKPVEDGDKTGKDPATGKFLPNNNFGGSHPDSNGKISLRKQLLKVLPTTLKGQTMPCDEALTFSLVIRAIKGDMQAMKLVWQYVEGDPKQSISIEPTPAKLFANDINKLNSNDRKKYFDIIDRAIRESKADRSEGSGGGKLPGKKPSVRKSPVPKL